MVVMLGCMASEGMETGLYSVSQIIYSFAWNIIKLQVWLYHQTFLNITYSDYQSNKILFET